MLAFQTNQAYIEDIKPLIIEHKPSRDNFKDIISENTSDTLNQIVCDSESPNNLDKMLFHDLSDAQSPIPHGHNADPVYLSIIRLCFWDRKLQEIEHEEIKEVILNHLNKIHEELDPN